ncbi:MAG: oligosaccharide flippase family protein [Candidatus Paceibacterota bacterium]
MGIIKKQSIQNSIIIYIGIGLGFITTLYLYPQILEPDQYGLTRLLLSVSFVCSQFAHLGMKNTAIKFFPYFEDSKTQHNGFLFLTLVIPFLGFLIFSVLLFLFSNLLTDYYQESELFVDYFWYLIPLVFGILYFEVINSYVRARLHSVPGSVISEVILRFLSIVLLVLYFYEWVNFREFMLGFVLSYMLQPLLLIVYLWQKGELFLKPRLNYLNTSLVKRMGNYGLFAVLGGMTTLVVNNIDIIMLGSLSGLTDTGIYAIAFYIGSVIIVPQKAIGKIAPTLVARHLKEKNLSEVERIYKSSSINQLIPGFLIFIGIWANLENLMNILPPDYSSTGPVIILIGLSKLIDMTAGINGTIILHSKYYRIDFFSTVFLVLFSIALNYWLIPLYGIVGAAIATTASLLVYNLLKGIFVWVKFSMQPLSPKILIVMLLSISILYLSFQVDQIGNLYADITLRSFTIAVIYSAGILLFNVSEEMNKMWLDVKSRLF